MAKIALIDARPLVREGMARWLKAIKRCNLSSFSNLADFFRTSDVDEPSAIVLSAGWGDVADREMLAAVDELASRMPEVPIIVLSDHGGDAALEAFRRGVRAYIPTTLDAAIVRAAFELVMVGGCFIPANALTDRAPAKTKPQAWQVLENPMRRVNLNSLAQEHSALLRSAQKGLGDFVDMLTARETQVLACIQQGKPNKVIAFELNIRESTVKVHVGHLMRKLNAANRTQLAIRMSRGALGTE